MAKYDWAKGIGAALYLGGREISNLAEEDRKKRDADERLAKELESRKDMAQYQHELSTQDAEEERLRNEQRVIDFEGALGGEGQPAAEMPTDAGYGAAAMPAPAPGQNAAPPEEPQPGSMPAAPNQAVEGQPQQPNKDIKTAQADIQRWMKGETSTDDLVKAGYQVPPDYLEQYAKNDDAYLGRSAPKKPAEQANQETSKARLKAMDPYTQAMVMQHKRTKAEKSEEESKKDKRELRLYEEKQKIEQKYKKTGIKDIQYGLTEDGMSAIVMTDDEGKVKVVTGSDIPKLKGIRFGKGDKEDTQEDRKHYDTTLKIFNENLSDATPQEKLDYAEKNGLPHEVSYDEEGNVSTVTPWGYVSQNRWQTYKQAKESSISALVDAIDTLPKEDAARQLVELKRKQPQAYWEAFKRYSQKKAANPKTQGSVPGAQPDQGATQQQTPAESNKPLIEITPQGRQAAQDVMKPFIFVWDKLQGMAKTNLEDRAKREAQNAEKVRNNPRLKKYNVYNSPTQPAPVR